jgi:uncharacterized protein
MGRPMTEAERKAFLAEPHVAVLSVAGEAGRPPLAAPSFYAYRPGGAISFFTNTQRGRARKVERIDQTGRVTLTVQSPEPPYRYVTVEASVVRADRSPAFEEVLAIARRYMPEEHARGMAASEVEDPESTLILYTVRPDRWLSADFTDEAA